MKSPLILNLVLGLSVAPAGIAQDKPPAPPNPAPQIAEDVLLAEHKTSGDPLPGASVKNGPVQPSRSAGVPRDLSRAHVAGMIGVWFRPGTVVSTNTYYGFGPERETANIVVVTPVVPFNLTEKWMVISRWVTPILSLPRFSPSHGPQFGIGNIQPEFYLAPAHQGRVLWGVGPKAYLPTATNSSLGVNKWGGGPAAAFLTYKGPLAVGALVNNVWAGSGSRSVNQLTVNPLVYFYLDRGWYLVSAPLITADWHAASRRWTVPAGLGVGRYFKLADQQFNARVQFLNNVVRSAFAPSWQFQTQIQFLFPQGSSRKHFAGNRSQHQIHEIETLKTERRPQ